jgi:hypothetical protein
MMSKWCNLIYKGSGKSLKTRKDNLEILLSKRKLIFPVLNPRLTLVNKWL